MLLACVQKASLVIKITFFYHNNTLGIYNVRVYCMLLIIVVQKIDGLFWYIQFVKQNRACNVNSSAQMGLTQVFLLVFSTSNNEHGSRYG